MIYSGIFHKHNTLDTFGINAEDFHDHHRRASVDTLGSMLGAADFLEPSSHSQPQHSHVWLIRVPAILAGVRYGDLFEFLAAEYHAIPLGLYRRAMMNEPLDSGNQSSSAMSPSKRARLELSKLMDSVDVGDGQGVGEENAEEETVHHFVYCNPTPMAKLRADDRIYVLSTVKPSFSNN